MITTVIAPVNLELSYHKKKKFKQYFREKKLSYSLQDVWTYFI